jgi:hypothetical protein
VSRITVLRGLLSERGRPSDGWPALAYMEKIMSNTRRTESCEVRESGELTDDKFAAVVGGEKNELNLARHDFKNGDYASGFAHLTAGMADVKTWL